MLQLELGVVFSVLTRDLKCSVHVNTGGLRLIHVGAAAELHIASSQNVRAVERREQRKLMALTSASFLFF